MRKKISKSLVAMVLVTAMVAMAGCGKTSSSSSAAATTTPAAETTTPAETTTVAGITSFEDVNTDKVKLIALGNSDVPVGQYSQELFTKLGVWDGIQSKISFGTNVKEVLSQVEEGSVDCGVVYTTDAKTSDKVKVVATATEDMFDSPVTYPVAMLSASKNPDAAKVFLDFLKSDAAMAEFTKVGFESVLEGKSSDLTYSGADCTLTVLAAASLTESLTSIQALFEAKYPSIKLVFSFDSSGTLKTQIESGTEADIFFSAAQKQMTALTDEKYIDTTTKYDILKNMLVLIVPAE